MPDDPPTRNATYRQSIIPVGPNNGDLWFDPALVNVQYRYESGDSISIEYGGTPVEYGGLLLTYLTGNWILVRDGLIQ
ncbi:hypothetical protein U2075_14885, partial [Listeria monocytogenes]